MTLNVSGRKYLFNNFQRNALTSGDVGKALPVVLTIIKVNKLHGHAYSVSNNQFASS